MRKSKLPNWRGNWVFVFALDLVTNGFCSGEDMGAFCMEDTTKLKDSFFFEVILTGNCDLMELVIILE